MDLITAVANLVRDQGLEVGVPVNLRSTNNVVAWMRPSPVVAKIARSVGLDHRPDDAVIVAKGQEVMLHGTGPGDPWTHVLKGYGRNLDWSRPAVRSA